MKSSFGIKDNVHVILYDEFGNIKYEHTSHNQIQNAYDAIVAEYMMQNGSTVTCLYMHAGTSTGQATTDTDLAAMCPEPRTVLTSSTKGAGADDNDIVHVGTLGAGVCTGTLTEVGLFGSIATVTADMYLYDDSINVTKGAADSLQVTWTLTFGAS